MKSNHNAYHHAHEIDEIINRALRTDPITANNWQQWALFVRTVNSSLELLNGEIARAKLKSEEPAHLGQDYGKDVHCRGLPGGKPCVYPPLHAGPCHNENYFKGYTD